MLHPAEISIEIIELFIEGPCKSIHEKYRATYDSILSSTNPEIPEWSYSESRQTFI